MANAAVMKTSEKKKPTIKEFNYKWEGKDKKGRTMRGETRATSEMVVKVSLRNKGITPSSIKQQRIKKGKPVTPEDVAVFTRQLSTIMKAGVPLLQGFEIIAQGHNNPSVSKLLLSIKQDVEGGTSLSDSFRKQDKYFDALYCNLIGAGEQAGILDTILERLATYKEKMQALKKKIKSALTYPMAIMGVAVIVLVVIMVFVIPSFKKVFSSFGAELPLPTQIVINMSDFVVGSWYILLAIFIAIGYTLKQVWQRVPSARLVFERYILKVPVIGDILYKSAIARWARTLATMFSAGVPLVEALDSVAGAAGNIKFYNSTKAIQTEISTGQGLAVSMQNQGIFPNMVIQMTQIGEEAGSLDVMLTKVAEFYEAEVDESVKMLSSLMEPFIMVFLGVVIGGLVVALYMPIFKLGSVV